MQFTILGSGSAGNCAYIETAEERVLVDAGFSPRQIRQRLARIGRTPEKLTATRVTDSPGEASSTTMISVSGVACCRMVARQTWSKSGLLWLGITMERLGGKRILPN